MKQIISKDGKVVCVTTIPYSSKVIKEMKQAGYEECFKRVEEARTSTPVKTAELEEIRDIYGYDLYIECLNAVISKHKFN